MQKVNGTMTITGGQATSATRVDRHGQKRLARLLSRLSALVIAEG